MSNETTVSASEVGDYAYCKRCWWLRLHGLKPARYTAAMEAGSQAHNQLQVHREHVFRQRHVALLLVAAGAILLLVALLLHLLG